MTTDGVKHPPKLAVSRHFGGFPPFSKSRVTSTASGVAYVVTSVRRQLVPLARNVRRRYRYNTPLQSAVFPTAILSFVCLSVCRTPETRQEGRCRVEYLLDELLKDQHLSWMLTIHDMLSKSRDFWQ